MKTKYFCKSILCLRYQCRFSDFPVQLSALAAITDMTALDSNELFGQAMSSRDLLMCESEIPLTVCMALSGKAWLAFLCPHPSQFLHAKLSSYMEGTGKRWDFPPKGATFFENDLNSQGYMLACKQSENELLCVSFWKPFVTQTGVQCPNERWGIFSHNLLCASSAVVLMGGSWTEKRKTAFSFLEL